MRISPEKFLMGVSLLILGTTLSEIEKVLGVKSETLRHHADRFLKREGGLALLDAMVTERFPLPDDYRLYFGLMYDSWVEFGNQKTSFFRYWGQQIRNGVDLNPDGARQSKRVILREARRLL